MDIRQDAERARAGQSLIDMSNQANSAVAQLVENKKNLLGLKEKMQGEITTYTSEDIDAVDAVLEEIKTKISSLL